MDYKIILSDIFPNHSEQQIDYIIEMVLENRFNFNDEELLDSMIIQLTNNNDNIDDEGAVGFNLPFNEIDYQNLLRLYSDICPQYLREICNSFGNNFNINDIIEKLSNDDYIKIERDPLDILEQLKQMLPNADPNYLKIQANILVKCTSKDIENFVCECIENNNYPTLKEYFNNIKNDEEILMYTKNFNIKQFLQLFPECVVYYESDDYKSSINNDDDKQYTLKILYNLFPYLRKKDITMVLERTNNNIYKTSLILRRIPKAFRKPRPLIPICVNCKNISLLKEIAYIKHENSIKHFIKMKNDSYQEAYKEAQKYNLLETCQCCFDDTLLPEECYFCLKSCIFCKTCIRTSAMNVISEGGLRISCLADCSSEFSIMTLQMVLDKVIFTRFIQNKQIHEIEQANIDDLESCPFCHFSMIISDKNNKIFKCNNSECLKETCRKCKHESHLPLDCNEIEYDEDVKLRNFIEDKMTDALLRECWKCSRRFYKESGCNKMTCICGAKLCYLCRQPITDYKHFSSTGCSLFTNNLEEFHCKSVLNAANQAKEQLGVIDNPEKLKFDPTKNLTIN